MIRAPFNFVPLNDEVFHPSWSNEVSHDIPFEDGESGVIDIKITAKSPIFIRDHDNENKFCSFNGEYYIPGSSVKGMIRNVLEIMSFSKMNENSFTDNTYAVRDLSSSKNFYMKEMKPANTFCGWLKKEGSSYIIEDCLKPGRIKHEEIDKMFNIAFSSKFKKGKFGDTPDDKTALSKYNLINSDYDNYISNFTFLKDDVNRKIYTYDAKGDTKATLVLTGQPSGRDEKKKIPSGKIYEFLFFDKKEDILLDKEVVEDFKFAYFDERTTQPKESPDWKYWKKKLENGDKVPVFFQKNGKKIKHFGLSYLYKLPYNYSVKDGIPENHNNKINPKLDLVQTIFGHINEDSALKGRVQFSHFKAISNIKELPSVSEVLGTPRASYYPMYVKQNGKDFLTFMDKDFSLAGRKRYPIHKSLNTKSKFSNDNENIKTTFEPLDKSIIFSGKLRYHNLKKAELGALLSALTFHNTKDTFHSIGLAKSLSYGKIKIDLNGLNDLESYLKEFELEISEQIENWSKSPQLLELLTMASEQNNKGNSILEYMALPEFTKCKNEEVYLKSYSRLEGIEKKELISLINPNEIKELKRRKEENILKQKLIKEHNKAWNDSIISNSIQSYESFCIKYPESNNIEESSNRIKDLKTLEIQRKENEKSLESKKKWDSMHESVNKKYLDKKSLLKFCADYPDSIYSKKAEIEIDLLSESDSKKSTSLDDLVNANDAKKFKEFLIDFKLTNNINDKKDEIKNHIINLHKTVNKKKRNKFFKDLQLKSLFDQEYENMIKKLI